MFFYRQRFIPPIAGYSQATDAQATAKVPHRCCQKLCCTGNWLCVPSRVPRAFKQPFPRRMPIRSVPHCTQIVRVRPFLRYHRGILQCDWSISTLEALHPPPRSAISTHHHQSSSHWRRRFHAGRGRVKAAITPNEKARDTAIRSWLGRPCWEGNRHFSGCVCAWCEVGLV